MYLLIDNYDSFTYNLVHYLGELGADFKVFRNDQIGLEDVIAMDPWAIVLSPGPKDPDHAGICLDMVKFAEEYKTPLLGVCLGHQTIGQYFGGKVIRGPEPVHGKVHPVLHNDLGLFRDIRHPVECTRYHSLVIDQNSFPDCLEVTAKTEDGQIMGMQHRSLPIHGLQFHPESIRTEDGHAMLKNFLDLSLERKNAA